MKQIQYTVQDFALAAVAFYSQGNLPLVLSALRYASKLQKQTTQPQLATQQAI